MVALDSAHDVTTFQHVEHDDWDAVLLAQRDRRLCTTKQGSSKNARACFYAMLQHTMTGILFFLRSVTAVSRPTRAKDALHVLLWHCIALLQDNKKQ